MARTIAAAPPRTLRVLDAAGRPISARDIARVRARASLSGDSPVVSYDAGQITHQDMAGWHPWLGHADQDLTFDRDRIVARTRDLVRNDGWASGGINRILDAKIGASFRLNARPDARALGALDARFDAAWAVEFSAAAEAEWRLWAEDPNRLCDATRQLTVTQMFRLAARHKLLDGEALAMLLWAPDRRVGAGWATTLQIIDPDRLGNPNGLSDTALLRSGVALDEAGAATGYHIRQAHPNDWTDHTRAITWEYYPRWTPWGRPVVVHDFDVERAGQHRGAGVLAPVLARFKMVNRLDQATLQAAILRTLIGFFIRSPYDADAVQDSFDTLRTEDGRDVPGNLFAYDVYREMSREKNPVVMGGVRVPVLAPGEEVQQVQATGTSADFEAFEGAFLRSIASATGQTAEEVTGDYRKVNYSSARAALLVAWRTLLRRRADFAAGFATPVYAAWLEEAVLAGRLPLPRPVALQEFAIWRAAFARCGWIGPGRGWVDPVKERQGEQIGLEMGTGTLADVCAEVSGRDWREVLEQRAVEREYARSLGLPDFAWNAGMPAAPVAAETEEEVA